jgi:hypothetical protein
MEVNVPGRTILQYAFAQDYLLEQYMSSGRVLVATPTEESTSSQLEYFIDFLEKSSRN